VPRLEKVNRTPEATIPFPPILGLFLRFHIMYGLPCLLDVPELLKDGKLHLEKKNLQSKKISFLNPFLLIALYGLMIMELL
jgi:hypothetical protein